MDGVLDNATQQIVYELVKMILGLAGLVTTYYVNKWLQTNSFAKKYELDEIITEKTLERAVMYAEQKGREQAVKGIKKRELANEYIDMLEPDMVKKYGTKLDTMLDRKVSEKLNKDK